MLADVGIKRIVDVRRFPKSKWPEFRGENLEEELPERGMDYVHLKGLGGYRNGGYEDHMKTDDFRDALKELEDLARDRKTVIMCLESYPSGCHRRYIARELDKKGWKVKHLVGREGKRKALD